MNVLVLGAGQVGKALASIIETKHNVTLMDVEAQEAQGEWDFDVMHVCYPYNGQFVKETVAYMRKFHPSLTIIESTVKLGTTAKIRKDNKCWKIYILWLCHSPIRGRHNQLTKDILRYTKFIGPCDEPSAIMAWDYYRSLGLKTYVAKSPLETECAKLMNLSYYATNIALFQEFERVRDKHGLNYQDIIRFFETTTVESKGEVPRPIYEGNHIGGTCVMQGLNMLFNPSKMAEWINESNMKARS